MCANQKLNTFEQQGMFYVYVWELSISAEIFAAYFQLKMLVCGVRLEKKLQN